MGAGGTPIFSYVFFPSSEKWLTPVIARIGEYTQAEAYLQEGLDLAFTGGLHPGENRFGVLDLSFIGELFVIYAGDFDVDVDAIQERGADLLLVAGDSYGGTTTFFDGGAVEGAGEGLQVVLRSETGSLRFLIRCP
jgi:hypothetical protein